MTKLAVVTGTSGQLGPIWVETLGEMGVEVKGVDLPVYDVSNRSLMFSMAKNSGWIPDVIVLNSAIDNPPGSPASFHGNLERILQVNLMGACYVVEAFLPAMIQNGGGVIICVSSIMGRIGADWRNYPEGWEKPVGYNLSKAALEQYVRSLTVQYGRHNIRACGIGFGPVDTPKLLEAFKEKFIKNIPMGRFISRESCKATLRYAVECPELAGQTVMVDGGYTAW